MCNFLCAQLLHFCAAFLFVLCTAFHSVADFFSLLCAASSLCYVWGLDAFSLRKHVLARFARCKRFGAAAGFSEPQMKTWAQCAPLTEKQSRLTHVVEMGMRQVNYKLNGSFA